MSLIVLVPTFVAGQVGPSGGPATDAVRAYDLLADSAVAGGLKLSEEQQAQVSTILKERDEALAAASEEEKAAVLQDARNRLAGVLNDDQRELFETLYVKQLQFNFQYQKWVDVLEWIAEESGLSLVMDAPPAGTFNYSDSREYTPTEAIDLLNGWLQTKNYTLVRRGRLLMLLDLSEGVPVEAIPRIPIDELSSRGRFELVSVLVPLGERPAAAAIEEIQPLLGRHGTAKPLPQTKQLLITDTAGNLRAIRELVEALPVPAKPPAPQKPPEPVLVVYPLEHANPDKVGQVLEEMISGTVVVDATASQVSVNAVPGDQERAKAIIAQLEQNQGPETQPRLETYPAPAGESAELISTLQLVAPSAQVFQSNTTHQLRVWASPQDQLKIRQTLDALGASSGEGADAQLEVYPVVGVTPQAAMITLKTVFPGIRVTVDETSNKLIVVGPLAQHQAVKRLIEQLEAPGDPRLETTVESYPLRRIDSSVTSLLSTLVPNARISPDSAGTQLIVAASGDDQQRIREILEQIDGEDESTHRKVATYPLDRQVDLATVTQLLTQVAPRAQVTPDAASHRLLVVATPDEHKMVAAAIDQASKDAGVALPELQFYTLDQVDVSQAVALLQSIVPTAQITGDPQLKRLSVIARPDDHEVVQTTLTRLEEVSREPEERALHVYDVAPTQKSRFQSLASALSSELPRMQVLSDSEEGELAIWAAPSEHAVIEGILQQLKRDIPEELAPKLVSYPLLKTDAQSMSTVLTPLFPNVRINVDPKANRLLIWARPQEHETLRQALKELDTDAPINAEFQLMAFPVEGITPDIAAQMIQAELPGLTVVTDPTAKSVVVRARRHELERIAEMLDSLKESGLGVHERSVVVYPSIPGDANEIYSFFARAIPSAPVLVDRATGRMTVWATESEHAQIRNAVSEMIGAGDGGQQATLKTYALNNAPPGTVTPLINQVAPTAKLAVSADGRHLSVWARPADHQLIEEVVAGLSDGPTDGTKRTVAVFDVKRIGTSAARSLLAPIVPQVSFADAPDGRALLAWVDQTDRERIQSALELVQRDNALSGERVLRVYDLTDVGGPQAHQVLTSTMPSVTFTSTDGGNSVVVLATPADQEQIEKTIAELASTQPFQDDRTLEIYSIRDLGSNVSSMLSALVPNATINTGPQSDQIAVTARPDDQQEIAEIIARLKSSSRPRYRTVAAYDIGRADPDSVRQIMQPLVDADTQITVDANTRRVFVRAYADKLEGIESIVKRITEEPTINGQLVTRTYPLNPGDADNAQEVLQALLPNATLVTDTERRVLAATATPEQHEVIKSVVEQMRGAFGSEDGAYPVAYPLKTADPESILPALQQLFARTPEVALSMDRPTRTLVAIARPDQQATIRQLVEQLDRADGDGHERTVEVYPMRGTDSNTAVSIIRTLLEEIDRDAKVAYNPQTRQVVVTTRPEGQALVREMTAQFGMPDERDVEVFQLERMEPLTAQLAIDGLFDIGRTDPQDLPSIQTNEETQQLIVRAKPEQIDQIREVLIKMGEVSLSTGTSGSRNVRVIPVDGDLDLALPRIEQLWPRLRRNPLRILRPGDDGPQELRGPSKPQGDGTSSTAPLPWNLTDRTQPVAFVQENAEREENHGDEPQPDAETSTESETQADAEQSPSNGTADAEPPAVVIIPGPDRVTIVSEDAEALNQLETLLRGLLGGRDTVRGRDFTVYALQNAGAATVADTINEFFKRNSPVSSSNVLIVPDFRLNALIVYAGRADRERIEDLIQTLDSENIPDSLAAFQTKIVPIVHADATEIAQMLRGIYRAQMTAGGARQNVSIPEGVPSSIASVLRQINAAASSPLLTVEVDSATNSLVLMAPNNLLEEVSDLVARLDEAAAVSQARVLRIIPLQKSRSARVMELLQKITD